MKKVYALLIAVAFLATAAEAKVVKGVNIPDTFNAGGTKLILNGTGIRTKFMMNIYVGALYLKAKSGNGSAIAGANEPMAVRLHILSGLVTPKRMADSTREGFTKSAGGNIGPYKAGMDKFINTFSSGIKVGDFYDIVYLPGKKGVQVYKNGVPASFVAGLDFKKILYGIWIGPNCIQEPLKKGMLGL
ncbi:MAG: chalcone isomerase family protein [Spirochaetes bacterium]|nr:chalcone isomerase family protein [Spirochaetota bacterium]